MGWYRFTGKNRIRVNVIMQTFRWAALLFSLMIIIIRGGTPLLENFNGVVLLILSLYSLIVSFIYPVAVKRGFTMTLISLTDILISVSAVAMTGQWSSPFIFYSFIPVFNSAILYKGKGALKAIGGYILLCIFLRLASGGAVSYWFNSVETFILLTIQIVLFNIFYIYSSMLFLWNNHKEEMIRNYEESSIRFEENSKKMMRLCDAACGMSRKYNIEDVMDTLLEIGKEIFNTEDACIFLLNEGYIQGYGDISSQDHKNIKRFIMEYSESHGDFKSLETYNYDGGSIIPLIRGNVLDAVILLKSGNVMGLTREDALQFTMVANIISTYLEVSKINASKYKEVVLNERKRIARDLHDGPTQWLFLLSAQLQKCRRMLKQKDGQYVDEELVRLQKYSTEIVQDIRRYIYNLKTGNSGSRGSIEIIEDFLNGIRAQYGVVIEYIPKINTKILDEVGDNLTYIVQEGIYNVLKHAGAKWIKVFLDVGEQVILIIDDDGKGFDMEEIHSDDNLSSKFGLKGIRERVEDLSGEFHVKTVRGQGTSLYISIPNRNGGRKSAEYQAAYSG